MYNQPPVKWCHFDYATLHPLLQMLIHVLCVVAPHNGKSISYRYTNTLKPEQNDWYFENYIYGSILLKENVLLSLKFELANDMKCKIVFVFLQNISACQVTRTLTAIRDQGINSLAPGRFDHSLKLVNFKLISTIPILGIFCEVTIKRRPQHLTGH